MFSLKTILWPLALFISSIALGVIAVVSGADTNLRAYGVPLLPPNSGAMMTVDKSVPLNATVDGQTDLSSNQAAALTETLPTETPSVTPTETVMPTPSATIAPSPTPSATPTPTPTVVPSPTSVLTPTGPILPTLAGCRQDCTTVACPANFVCMAIADDQGQYTYQCLNSACSPQSQGESCVCR